MSTEFFHRQHSERGVFKRVRSVIIRPSQTPPTITSMPRGILTRSMSARGGDAEKRKRTVLRRQNAVDGQELAKLEELTNLSDTSLFLNTESTWHMTMTSRPTSLSDAGIQLSPEAQAAVREASTDISLISSLAECDDSSRAMSKKEKYFAEKPDKNIFMKFIHPSYHERNLQFKKIFVDKGHIDENDQFLASYSCAYQREILAQGRMFISQFNVCFYANIIGWETHLVIPMKEIKLIKKMKAAFIFPNSIQFERVNGEKYFFASFINRDKSFQVLTTAHEKVGNEEGKAMTREEVWDMVYNSEDNKNSQHHTPPDGGTPKNASTENMTVLSSSRSQLTATANTKSTRKKMRDKDSASQSSSSTTSDFHEEDVVSRESLDDDIPLATDCSCQSHQGSLLFDREIKMSVEKFYELVFTETPFSSELNSKCAVSEYVAATWVRDHQGETSRTCAYIVTLNNVLAPKPVIVNEKQVLAHYPIARQGLFLTKETQNSGVPYADNFVVHCKYCISRTGTNSCRVKVHGGVVYRKSVWTVIKKIIETGTNKGLEDHYTFLNAMMDEYLVKHPDGGSPPPPNTIPTLSQPANKTADEQQPSISNSNSNSSSSSTNSQHQIRHRTSHKSRLTAGGENPHEMDENYAAAEVRPPRSMAEVFPATAATPTAVDSSSQYTPFLIVIIVLLAFFLFANLYILQSFRGETTAIRAVSPKQPDLMEMMGMLMEQVKELKEKVDTIQKQR